MRTAFEAHCCRSDQCGASIFLSSNHMQRVVAKAMRPTATIAVRLRNCSCANAVPSALGPGYAVKERLAPTTAKITGQGFQTRSPS